MTPPSMRAFVERWTDSGAAERANYQMFLAELCDALDVPRPDPTGPDDSQNAYVFERAVTFLHGDGTTSPGRIDLYRRGCFVLEAKQGAETPVAAEPALSDAEKQLRAAVRRGVARRGTAAWDSAMLRARGQAEQYARALPAAEGRPPFVAVVDVGHSIELFSEFSRTGGAYVPYPAPGSHRILLDQLEDPAIRERLRAVWLDPMSLDPTRRSARVTREIADRLARLAVSLEKGGHDPHAVAGFLMRCLFTMFAEDVNLLPSGAFTNLLASLRDAPEQFVPVVGEVWDRMNRGGFSVGLRTNVLQFNGGLFADATVLPLTRDQLLLLLEAAQSEWRDVEPAIFGTLLERALDPIERHKLGAHYTPRAYVERLVLPTIVQPIRAEWEAVHAAAVTLADAGDAKQAAGEVRRFHRKLAQLRVLDPACGSGNFLYVTLEHLKRIEGEVFDTLDALGERQAVLDMMGETVGPHQLLGIEVNPRAAAIAELVLWIGTLQWHFRNRGSVRPPQPIIRNLHNIECRDALITWKATEPLLDAGGKPVTHWDGRTTKPHPVTGNEVPDESARVPVLRYIDPQPATWPDTDYIVGNPPFIGPAIMRQALGDGYTEAVRAAHDDVSESSDFVMYWWNHAARLVSEGKVRRFGFVSTNSLRQKFNRRVLERWMADKSPVSLAFAIPDHPWVDAADGAAVRIAMSCASAGDAPGLLQRVVAERESEGDGYDVELASTTGKIRADLTVGADVAGCGPLRGNEGIANKGFELGSQGFLLDDASARALLERDARYAVVVKPYMNGRDLATGVASRYVLDFHGMSECDARTFPELYQLLVDRVLPERRVNREGRTANRWWLFRRSGVDLRNALQGLSRMIGTTRTARHRVFQFLPVNLVAESKIVVVASDDALMLGVLSSRLHVVFATHAGGWLGVGNDPTYNHVDCFNKFPFPAATPEQAEQIRVLGEQLDAHRKARQAEHAELTMTGMYNVLEKLRAGEALTAKEKKIHEQGLVSVLRQIHDELDAAVFAAYGWPTDLDDAAILERLVALNAERAAEESRGLVRWLRPECQEKGLGVRGEGEGVRGEELGARGEGEGEQEDLPLDTRPRPSSSSTPAPHIPHPESPIPNPPSRAAWPGTLPEQVTAVRAALDGAGRPLDAEAVARLFARARGEKVDAILQTLVTVGQARKTADGRYVGR